MIIDTETANSIEQPLPYDIGYAIIDTEKDKILLEKSFVVAEIFLDKELMTSAYYAEKIPQYWDEIASGQRTLKGIYNIRKEVQKDVKEYNIKKVGAYNMGFDKRATVNDIRFISGSFVRWFFPFGTEFFCIWNMACSSILNTKEYIDFAVKNNYISPKGNINTNAEKAYAFIKNDTEFKEEHTGLEDVKIEIEIYRAVLRSGMDFDESIKPWCWRSVQNLRKELNEA